MLKFFSVSNFKSFKDEIQLNFSLDDNRFIIIGDNSSGKSNLALALLDLTKHLNSELVIKSDPYYLNNLKEVARFTYEFIFNNVIVTYKYQKIGNVNLVKEELFFNHKRVLYYDYINKKGTTNLLDKKELKLNNLYNLSIINEIKDLVDNKIFKTFINYVKAIKLFNNKSINNKLFIDEKLYSFLNKFNKKLDNSILNGSYNVERFSTSEVELINLYSFLNSNKNASLIILDNFAFSLDKKNINLLLKILKKYAQQMIIISNNISILKSDYCSENNIFLLKKD